MYTETFTEKVLTFLQSGAEAAVDMLGSLALSPGEFQRDYKRFLARGGPRPFRKDWADWYRKWRIYTTMLSRMKKQGLIRKRSSRGGTAWVITKEGIERLKLIKARRQNPNSLTTAHYVAGMRREVTIVSFDIPEREKGKRRWLRAALGSLSFSLLHKSVWIGTQSIPEEFLDALRERDLLRHVHIVGVTKRGTLEKIV
ncbi:MAG: hypothetical protein AAB916_00105 [Patescibacteria group bacterium]